MSSMSALISWDQAGADWMSGVTWSPGYLDIHCHVFRHVPDYQLPRPSAYQTQQTTFTPAPPDIPPENHQNGPVSRRQQITLRATLISHFVDVLLSTTAAHEVRRAGGNTWSRHHESLPISR